MSESAVVGFDCDYGCGCGERHCVRDGRIECVACLLTRQRDEWKRLALRDPMQLSDVTWRDCYEQLAEANQAHMRERDEARALVESLKAGNRKLHDQNTELMADVDQARAEVERLRSEAGRCDCDFCEAHGRSGHATRLLEALRERCATALDGHDGHYGLSGSAARRIVRAVPLGEPMNQDPPRWQWRDTRIEAPPDDERVLVVLWGEACFAWYNRVASECKWGKENCYPNADGYGVWLRESSEGPAQARWWTRIPLAPENT